MYIYTVYRELANYVYILCTALLLWPNSLERGCRPAGGSSKDNPFVQHFSSTPYAAEMRNKSQLELPMAVVETHWLTALQLYGRINEAAIKEKIETGASKLRGTDKSHAVSTLPSYDFPYNEEPKTFECEEQAIKTFELPEAKMTPLLNVQKKHVPLNGAC